MALRQLWSTLTSRSITYHLLGHGLDQGRRHTFIQKSSKFETDPPPSDAQSTTNEVQSVQTEPPPSDSQSTTNNSAVQGKGKGRASGFGMSDPADVANIVSPEPDDGIQVPSSVIGATFQMPDKAPQATETSFPRPTLTRRRPVQAAVATPRRSQTPLITGKGPQTPAWVMGNIAASQAIHFPSSPPERTVAMDGPHLFRSQLADSLSIHRRPQYCDSWKVFIHCHSYKVFAHISRHKHNIEQVPKPRLRRF